MEANAYSEIWEIINQLYPEDRNKIPKNIIDIIREKRNKEYKANIDLKIPLDRQRISKRATEILCYIEFNFLANKEQKEELKKIYTENEIQMSKKYDINNILAKRQQKKEENKIAIIEENKIAIIEEKWYEKILKKIKSIFKIFN